jgi:hypothetical protein
MSHDAPIPPDVLVRLQVVARRIGQMNLAWDSEPLDHQVCIALRHAWEVWAANPLISDHDLKIATLRAVDRELREGGSAVYEWARASNARQRRRTASLTHWTAHEHVQENGNHQPSTLDAEPPFDLPTYCDQLRRALPGPLYLAVIGIDLHDRSYHEMGQELQAQQPERYVGDAGLVRAIELIRKRVTRGRRLAEVVLRKLVPC